LRLELLDDRLRHGLLLRRVIEDGRAVLRADVPTLTVQRGRVVNREEDVEQVVERYDGGVEGDLDDLGVARGAGADFLVRRVRDAPAGVARLHLLDALQILEGRLEAPEAPAGQSSDFALRHGTNLRRGPKNYCIESARGGVAFAALRTPSPRGNGTRAHRGGRPERCRRPGRRRRNPSRRRAKASRGATPPLRACRPIPAR